MVDEAHRAVGDERVQEFAPLTKGEALTAWSLKVGPLVDDNCCRGGPDGVIQASRGGAGRRSADQHPQSQE